MGKPEGREIARAVLRRYPRSYADELRIDLGKNRPQALYQWLIASLLFSARIGARQARGAAEALFAQGWRTPRKMAAVSWEERVKVLNRSGYARYDESTSRYIAEATRLLLDRYGGDLRKLRKAAGRDPARERELLKEFKGIGEVGADIFLREVQLAWEELYPFADKRALETACRLGLGEDIQVLARLVPRRDLPRFLAGLVHLDLAHETEELLKELA